MSSIDLEKITFNSIQDQHGGDGGGGACGTASFQFYPRSTRVGHPEIS